MHVQALHRQAPTGNPADHPTDVRSGVSLVARAARKARVPSACAIAASALIMATCSMHEPQPIEVSVRDVVIDPYAVDGKLVRLTGLLHRSSSGDALYWHERDIRQSVRSHAVSVQLPSSWPAEANRPGTYVAVQGIFEADGQGAASKFNGALLQPRHPEVR